MRIFLDTSFLFKLYHQEAGTADLEQVFTQASITHVFLPEITKVEFASTVWKKVRTREITADQANVAIALFEADFARYTFATTDSLLLEQARKLIIKYGLEGLRTLNGSQLATCLVLKHQAAVFFTADKLLKTLLEAEGLATEIPSLSNKKAVADATAFLLVNVLLLRLPRLGVKQPGRHIQLPIVEAN